MQLHVHREKYVNATEADEKSTSQQQHSETIMKKKILYKIISLEIHCATSDWTTPNNGVKDCKDGKKVKVNTLCRVECNFGYQLQGTSTAVCTTQGNWNPRSPPKCIGTYFCVIMER